MQLSLGGRLWGALLTGIPFAIYKFGVGLFAYQQGYRTVGYLAMAWGVIDIVLNLLSVWFPKKVSYCLLSYIGMYVDQKIGRIRWENILLGVDSLFALMMVAGMIWFKKLPLSPEIMSIFWDVAVVSNLIAVGSQQVWNAVRRSVERAAA